MRVARYYRNDDVRIEEMPRPEIGAGELLVRIEASGICGSDVVEWYRIKKAPIVLGHEVAGVVVEVGGGVTRFHPGDRVMATHHVPCNTCHYCLSGHHQVCDTLRSTHFDPGGFAEFVRLPAINVDRGTFLLPDHVRFEEAAFLEPLACVVRGQRKTGLRAGQSVLVLGSGMSGLLHIALARAAGAGLIVGTDVHPYRLEAARRLGADEAIDAKQDVPGRFRTLNGGKGADLIVICTAAPAAVEQAFQAVDRGGKVLMFALPDPDTAYPIPLFELWHDDVSLLHSYAGAPADIQEALTLIATGRVEVTPMITHRMRLAETGDAFRLVMAAAESLKIIIEPQR
jgi:L-iditol 2-dehydrogenase